jgi:sporulation integral membrane protein YlbJ
VLFPALLPFFVISELMLGLGLVHFFGTLLDPMMRPLFRVPGIGGFVMAMGFASGYPVGAKLTAQLWEQKLINRTEGERLVSFTTTSDPIFLIGAVSVGFFHDVSLAAILAITHYGTAVIIGVLMRYHGRRSEIPTGVELKMKHTGPIWIRAVKSMNEARVADGRPLGTMLAQAVRSSLQLVMVIGGLVVFFSVLMELLAAGQVMGFLYGAVNAILQLFAIPQPLSDAVVNGMFEVTLGAKAAGSALNGSALIHKTAIASFVLSWAGLSVHGQIVSLLHQTDLRYIPFLIARFAHGILAAAAVYALWEPLAPLRQDVAVFAPSFDVVAPWSSWLVWSLPAAGTVIALTFLLIGLLYVAYACSKKVAGWLK